MSQPNTMDVLQMYADIAKAELAKQTMAESIARALPEGTDVAWETQRSGETYEQRGQVVNTGSDSHIRVRNNRTGKTVSIGIHRAYGFSADGCRAP